MLFFLLVLILMDSFFVVVRVDLLVRFKNLILFKVLDELEISFFKKIWKKEKLIF